MSKFIPTGWKPLRDVVLASAADKVRRQLTDGELEAVRWYEHNGHLVEMMPSEWLRREAENWLTWGTFGGNAYRGDLILVREPIRAEPKAPLPAPKYLSPFLELMIEATAHFEIGPGATLPKKETLVEYFMGKSVPGGKPISPSQAEQMATFIRPPEAMRGGQTKSKRKG